MPLGADITKLFAVYNFVMGRLCNRPEDTLVVLIMTSVNYTSKSYTV